VNDVRTNASSKGYTYRIHATSAISHGRFFLGNYVLTAGSGTLCIETDHCGVRFAGISDHSKVYGLQTGEIVAEHLAAMELLSIISSWPTYRVLTLPELLRGPRNIKGLRDTTMNLHLHDGQPLDERCPAQSDSRQSQNATTRPFGEANTNCAEQLRCIFLFSERNGLIARGR
jgi:hypothetical protein